MAFIEILDSFRNRHFPKESFRNNVLKLTMGTVLSQAILVLTSPLLTRVFRPEEFGIFGLFTSLTTILALLSTGRYELAIMLPAEDREAFNLVALTATITLLVSLLWLCASVFLNRPLATLSGNREFSPWLYLLPYSILVASLYQVLYYWINRKKQFRRLALNKVIQSLITVSLTLALGVLKFGAGGLIIGFFVGQLASAAIFGAHIVRNDRALQRDISFTEMKQKAIRYKKFPLFSLPADFFNVASNQMPYLLLNNFFGAATAGYFLLTQRVLGAPISTVASAVLDVFKQRASREFNEHGNCVIIFKKTFKALVLLSLPPFILLFFLAPFFFIRIFGAEWKVAGQYTQILAVLYFLKFTSSPLSYVFYIAEKQNYDLIWQIVLFFLTTSSLIVGGIVRKDRLGLLLFSLTYTAMYVIYIIMSYHFSKGPKTPAEAS